FFDGCSSAIVAFLFLKSLFASLSFNISLSFSESIGIKSLKESLIDEGTLSEEHNVQEEDTSHPFFDDIVDKDAAVTPDLERKSDETEEVNIEEKEASNVKSGETEELDLETTQSTARQGTITPRTLNFEDEAGPSSPLRPIQVMESEEHLKSVDG
ncbi:hypothetical protein Tco_0170124, partial [Tanacetum coccineum]